MLLASLPPPVAKALILAWLFALGGAVGSFLNVVVYRLPVGMSLIQPGSHCPSCKRAIRWYDNVPVFGWIWLRGRCRDCRSAISLRYPMVEALVAMLFVLVGVVEGLSWGTNLPARPVVLADGTIFPTLSVGQVVGIVAYHLVLLSTLVAGALIESDGKRVPVRLALPALIVGGLAPLVWPHLHPVPAWSAAPVWMAGLVDSGAGLLVGAIWGLNAEVLILGSRDWGRAALWACVGVMLGWQAAAVLAVLSIAAYLFLLAFIRLWPEGKGPGWATSLSVTVLVWLMLWGKVVEHWPGLR